jgi:hypothetical protein
MVVNDLVVEFPHGSGGIFLSAVLGCCIKNAPWQRYTDCVPLRYTVNHHLTTVSARSNCVLDPAPNIISIDDPGARYNFWINYFKKRVLNELDWYRYNNRRWTKCPYQDLDSRGDAFWLINQCKFLINYRSQQPWRISWIQMLNDPASAWKVVQEYLETNNQPNYWNLTKWTEAVQEYQQTLPANIPLNTHHIKWQIWAVALLLEQRITPNFDLIDNFRNTKFLTWLDNYNQDLIKITKQCVWTPG